MPPGASPPPSGLSRPVRRGLAWGLLLAAIGIVALAALNSRLGRRATVLPILGAVPAFELTDHRGDAATAAGLVGAPWVADLVFTRCTLVCPAMSQRMARLDDRLPDAVRLVSLSVDPGHDTPAVLAAYAGRLDASERWLFLSGEPGAVRELAQRGFKLAVADDPAATGPGAAIVHSNRFVLVDARGRVRGYYDPFDPAALAALERGVRSLLAERG